MLRHCVGRSLSPEIWKRAVSTTINRCAQPTEKSEDTASAEPPDYVPPFMEVEVPVPWGHIAGKWWGSESDIPVIGLHGFEDNAGTYDRLAPLLKIPSFFAWDAPGHGRSSHMPDGHVYHFTDFLIALRLLVRRFGWEKISLIGHSWGSAVSLVYSALYPNSVQHYVSLDCARSIMPNIGVLGVNRLRAITNHMMKCDGIVASKAKPKQHQLRDVRNKIVQGTYESVLPDNCDPLILRGTLPHPDDPNSIYFSRDYRLRVGDVSRPTNSFVDQASRNIRCHVLSIYAKQGFITVVGQEVEKFFHEQEANMAKGAASFQSHLVKGTHHVHLNNPERVAPLINTFFGY